MRIVFICGTLEQGCDGVGDYVRRLGVELIRQGNEASIIALKDRYIFNVTSELQQHDGINIPVLRLPYKAASLQHLKTVNDFIHQKDPEWLSLQYVPYAFHNKGLPYGLASLLKDVGRKRKWHIMFHELWIGTEDSQFFKSKIFALLQKYIISRMINTLSPAIIHTHLPLYKEELDKFGCNALDLTLFSNITKCPKSVYSTSRNVFRVSFFSQIGINREIISFLQELKIKATENEQKLEILLIGGSKIQMASFAKQIKSFLGADTNVNYTGFLSPDEISIHLQSTSLGITPIPAHGLGKSGSVAAFIEHGVPVAVPITNKTSMPFFYPELSKALLFAPDLGKLARANEAVKEAAKFIDVRFIAKKLVEDLKQ